MPARRILDNEEHLAVIETVRDVVTNRLAPQVAEIEEAGQFPQDAFRTLGEIGVPGMVYPEELGGAGMPTELYLQTLEEIGALWASVAVGGFRPHTELFPARHFRYPRAAATVVAGDARRYAGRRLQPVGGACRI